MSNNMKEILTEGAKSTPPVAVVVHQAANGWTINNTVAALTVVYLLLQIGWLVWRWYRAAKGLVVKGE